MQRPVSTKMSPDEHSSFATAFSAMGVQRQSNGLSISGIFQILYVIELKLLQQWADLIAVKHD